jgi:hypothetical protein
MDTGKKKKRKVMDVQQRVAEAHIGTEKHGYGQEKRREESRTCNSIFPYILV